MQEYPIKRGFKEGLKERMYDGLEESFGIKTDVLNLLWIYRCKKYYNLPHEIIKTYILPYNTNLRKETLRKLIETDDLESFTEIISGTKYFEIFQRDVDEFFEVNFAEYMYNVHMRLFRRYPMTVSVAVDYIHMKEYELSNIISIIEGIRYGLRPEKIKKFVVGFNF